MKCLAECGNIHSRIELQIWRSWSCCFWVSGLSPSPLMKSLMAATRSTAYAGLLPRPRMVFMLVSAAEGASEGFLGLGLRDRAFMSIGKIGELGLTSHIPGRG